MHETLQKTLGRLLVILVFIAPVFIFNHYTDYYNAKSAQAITKNYLLDIQDNKGAYNITNDNMSILANSLSNLGFSFEITIQNTLKNKTLTDAEIRNALDEGIKLDYLDFVVVKIFNRKYCLYESAVAYRQI